MPLQDVKVSIDVRQPSALIGLGTPLILVEDATISIPTYKEYFTIDGLAEDFAKTDAGYLYGAKIMNQGNNRPEKVAIAKYNSADSIKPEQVLEQFFYNDFYFVLVADATQAEKTAIADVVEANGLKIVVYATDSEAEVDAFAAKKYDRLIIIYHSDLGELPEAALVGSVGSKPVGSVTWKFKTLAGVTPQVYSAGQLGALHTKGAISYVTKAGINQTSEGIVSSGEYIDVVHGKDWIRLNVEEQVQKLLSSVDKIPYTDAGIAQLESVVTNVLRTATTNGIVATNDEGRALYEITALSRSSVSDNERKSREYNGLGFSFELAGAIHEATIKGEVLI